MSESSQLDLLVIGSEKNMTKHDFIDSIIETFENTDSKEEAHEYISNLLTTLEPKDPEQFAKWGYPGQESTPENCWD